MGVSQYASPPSELVRQLRVLHVELAAVVGDLAGKLKRCGWMAGPGSVDQGWAAGYDRACGGRSPDCGVVEAASDIVVVVGQLHDLVLSVDVLHQYRALGRTDHPAFPPGSVEVFKVPKIPRAYGEEPLRATWGERAMLRVSRKMWRGYALSNAAAAWSQAATALRATANRVPLVLDLVAQRASPERAEMARMLGSAHEDMRTVGDCFETLGKACSVYLDAATSPQLPLAELVQMAHDSTALLDSTCAPVSDIAGRLPKLAHDLFGLFMIEPMGDLPELSGACDWLNQPAGPEEEDEDAL
ncbi:hypothetical protein Srot_2802 [Segniliparus rotundus DSM 44985]|uniref:Uncharacterized protein n=1 Tax=Segniliparus rotundus (strain ATCC BAA-972 / CDC 1076 / CIP 108378 / DSM 44985 / JCM 13578) TaxID=640132 RepID=D6ZD47_SEGRD|nr:hypothetical protein Srot_2802 [Segniliparus rotundus DSM 44985]